jgi:hypothetical protein
MAIEISIIAGASGAVGKKSAVVTAVHQRT